MFVRPIEAAWGPALPSGMQRGGARRGPSSLPSGGARKRSALLTSTPPGAACDERGRRGRPRRCLLCLAVRSRRLLDGRRGLPPPAVARDSLASHVGLHTVGSAAFGAPLEPPVGCPAGLAETGAVPRKRPPPELPRQLRLWTVAWWTPRTLASPALPGLSSWRMHGGMWWLASPVGSRALRRRKVRSPPQLCG